VTLPRLAVRRGVTFGMLFVMTIGFGIFSLSRLKLSLYPDITFPVIIVITQYSGAGPFDIETTITRPIEQAVASVENVKHVTSQSRKGMSFLVLEFDWGTDMEKAQTDVRRSLEWIEDAIPADAVNPLVFAFDPSQMPVIFFGLGSPILDQAQLRQLGVETLGPRLERINGVAAADVIGGLERQIRVDVNPHALASYGLPIDAIVGSLRGANIQIPGGLIRDGRTAFAVRTLGEYRSIDEIRNTVVTQRNGQTIRVADVALVEDSFREMQGDIRVNREPGLMIMIRKQSDANTVQVVERVMEQVPILEGSLPGQLTLTPIFDQAEWITQSLGNLSSTGMIAFILTALVLFMFLRSVRSSMVVAISIPVSVVFTFFVMDMAGVTLNIISMAGLALAVGMLVDNSIVVLENIYRHREMGYSPRDAADTGATQVGMAITASTLTTLAIFVPVLLVPGIAGVMFRDMVLAICFALFASLMVALTLIPLLASRLLTKEVARGGDKQPGRLEQVYLTIVDWSLSHRKTVIGSAVISFVGAIFLVGAVGVDFLPKADEGQIAFTMELKVGTDLPTTLRTVRRVEDYIANNIPEARNLYTTAGAEGTLGNAFRGLDTNSGAVQIRLKPRSERSRSQFDIQDQLRDYLDTIPGITYAFEEGGGMGGSQSDIEIKLFGDDLDRMEVVAEDIVRRVNDVPGAVDAQKSIKRGAPELRIELDRDRLQAIGLTAGQVTNTISQAIQGITSTVYREGGDEFDVFVRLGEQYRQSPSQVENLMIATPTGAQVPLRQIADVTREVGPVAVSREDQSRTVVVTANVSGRDLGSVVSDIRESLIGLIMPPEVTLEIGGTAEDQAESFKYLGLAIIAGIFLVYMVMASQFESLIDPLIILPTIPLSFVGAAIALFVTNTTLSLMAMIGMLVLVGIVVNNGIVLVDYTNQLRREKSLALIDAAREAGRVRMRPVLMTAMTTTVSMVPLAIGAGESGETWAPLARVVVGGLSMASVLTLIVVPVTYVTWERLAQRVHKWRGVDIETETGVTDASPSPVATV
jgi:hydrophobic/amphiphilic exporter-1 (mainly G- bacteria), HAE1 family